MYVRRTYHEEAGADGSTAGGAAAPAAPDATAAAAAPSPAPASPPAADGAPAAPAPQPGSLMARAAAAAAAGPAPAGAPATPGAGVDEPAAVVPDKYLVKNEDGTTNHEATALKVAQAHAALEKRMGAGEAPPKTPEEYAPEMPAGITAEQLKTDPLYAGFLKGAHSKGLNNAQVSYILGEFQHRMQLMNSPEVGEAALRELWPSDQQLQAGLTSSYRSTQAFAEDKDHAGRLEQKFGNDPDYIRLMARIGKELGEDKPPAGLSPMESDTLEDLKKHPAYSDAKHPEHAKVKAKVTALYEKQYAD